MFRGCRCISFNSFNDRRSRMKPSRLSWLLALALGLAARIAKQAAGKLKVEVYPAEQLGNNARMLEGLNIGTVEAVIGPPEFIVGVDPRFQVVGAPGLVKDLAHAVRLSQDDKFREALFGYGEAKGIKGIGLVVYGGNTYATRRPVRSLADFQGM